MTHVESGGLPPLTASFRPWNDTFEPEANIVKGYAVTAGAGIMEASPEIWVPRLLRHFKLAPTSTSGLAPSHQQVLTIPDSEFALTNPDNRAYYMDTQGILPFQHTYGNLNLSMSKPHFLDCDPLVASAISGLAPANSSLHDTFLTVYNGVLVGANHRIQINFLWPGPMMMNNTDQVTGEPESAQTTWFPHTRPTQLPLYWYDEHFDIPEPPQFPTPPPPPPTPAPPQCDPEKGCNVCEACCKTYISDGAPCMECAMLECGAECNPVVGCNVCEACCKPYIGDGAQCDDCVAHVPTPAPPPAPPSTCSCFPCGSYVPTTSWGGLRNASRRLQPNGRQPYSRLLQPAMQHS